MKKKKQPTLASMTALYKKRGFKRPRSHAKQYMAGFKAAKAGAISAKDMTSEAALTKLMWVLAKTKKLPEIKRLMEANLSGELEDEI